VKVFISWAGKNEPSHRVALALYEWIPAVIQAAEPWLSSESLDAGTRWSGEVAAKLGDSNFCIICATPTSVQSPWLNFEAGAISKNVDKARVVPFLIGMESSQMTGPLTQFQATASDQAGVLMMVKSLNKAQEKPLSDAILEKTFDRNWKELADKIDSAQSAVSVAPAAPRMEEMVPEILESVRALSNKMSELVDAVGTASERSSETRGLALLSRAMFGLAGDSAVSFAPQRPKTRGRETLDAKSSAAETAADGAIEEKQVDVQDEKGGGE
jgi:hypothetical protein